MAKKDLDKSIEIIKKNITLNIETLINKHNVAPSDIRLVWENTEKFIE